MTLGGADEENAEAANTAKPSAAAPNAPAAAIPPKRPAQVLDGLIEGAILRLPNLRPAKKAPVSVQITMPTAMPTSGGGSRIRTQRGGANIGDAAGNASKAPERIPGRQLEQA